MLHTRKSLIFLFFKVTHDIITKDKSLRKKNLSTMDNPNNNNYNFNDNKNVINAINDANNSFISNKEKAKLREPNSINIKLEEVSKEEIEKRKQEKKRKALKEAFSE